jgi:hypothetical protein
MQRRCKCNNRTSVARGVFYVVLRYPLLGNGCIFYGPPRDNIRSKIGIKSEQEREREWSESSAVKEELFGLRLIVTYCNCDYE